MYYLKVVDLQKQTIEEATLTELMFNFLWVEIKDENQPDVRTAKLMLL